MTNITIGQYYPVDSAVHDTDPRVKLLFTALYISMLFVADSLWGYLFVTAFLLWVIWVSKVPLKLVAKGLKPIAVIIIFTSVLNIFFTPGAQVLLEVLSVRITMEGILTAGHFTARLILLIAGSSILTLTTSPLKLTDALEYFLKPFKFIGVPAHEIAMMMTIALRFIPTLMEETDKIIKAQTARGADFDKGGIIKKAKGMIPLMVPLFVSAFRRADDLAVAMEARCYRGDIGRTKLKQMRLGKSDYGVLALAGMFVAVCIAIR